MSYLGISKRFLFSLPMFTKANQVKDVNKNMATCHKVHLSPAINHVNNQWISSNIYIFFSFLKNTRMGARPNIYLFPFWTYLDEARCTYLVIPISSIKGESDGQEGLQHHCLLGKSFSCTKTSQQSVNILQYFDFQLSAGKALRQGADQILICALVELILMKSSEYTLWFQSYQSKASQVVKKVYNTPAFWEVFLLRKNKSTISECS